MRAVLLCGGKGERLRPLTFEMNKVLIPVHNNDMASIFKLNCLLDEVLDVFYKYNVFETWLVCGYKANQLLDRYSCPAIVERHPMGTGGWLKLVDDKTFNDDFFACNGDNLFDLNLQEMYDVHKAKKAVVTIACTKVSDVRAFGSVHIKNSIIQNFEEKKKSRIKKSGYINGGYYLISPEIFKYIEPFKDQEKISLEYDIFPVLAREGKLAAYVSTAPWFSCNDFKEYEKLIKEWQGVNVHDGGGTIRRSKDSR